MLTSSRAFTRVIADLTCNSLLSADHVPGILSTLYVQGLLLEATEQLLPKLPQEYRHEAGVGTRWASAQRPAPAADPGPSEPTDHPTATVAIQLPRLRSMRPTTLRLSSSPIAKDTFPGFDTGWSQPPNAPTPTL